MGSGNGDDVRVYELCASLHKDIGVRKSVLYASDEPFAGAQTPRYRNNLVFSSKLGASFNDDWRYYLP